MLKNVDPNNSVLTVFSVVIMAAKKLNHKGHSGH